MLKESEQEGSGPPLLENLRSLSGTSDEGSNIVLWVGGLVIPYQKPPQDAVEWNILIPVSMLWAESKLFHSYKESLSLANRRSRCLEAAIDVYCKVLVPAFANERSNRNEAQVLRESMVSKGKLFYWQELDQRYKILFDPGNIDDQWRRCVAKAMMNAYEHICPRETPKQIQAFSAGLEILMPKNT